MQFLYVLSSIFFYPRVFTSNPPHLEPLSIFTLWTGAVTGKYCSDDVSIGALRLGSSLPCGGFVIRGSPCLTYVTGRHQQIFTDDQIFSIRFYHTKSHQFRVKTRKGVLGVTVGWFTERSILSLDRLFSHAWYLIIWWFLAEILNMNRILKAIDLYRYFWQLPQNYADLWFDSVSLTRLGLGRSITFPSHKWKMCEA